nr:hypothetical protein [Coprococcus sp. AF21-14LB]
MGKLFFRYGAMGSSKTANLLMAHYNFQERGRRPIILKPKMDLRDGEKIVKSRIGLQASCTLIEEFEMKEGAYDAILVDEANFLTEAQVDWLAEICDTYDIPVLCYGLKTDFQGRLFEVLSVFWNWQMQSRRFRRSAGVERKRVLMRGSGTARL